MKRWYAVHCKPGQDERAEQHLRHQRYEVFRPLARLRRRLRGQMRAVIESLFPRYLFVRLDDHAENWAPIRSTRGVRDLVRFAGGCPGPVPNVVIESLCDQTDPETGCVELARNTDFQPDQPVTIMEGPFAGREALFVSRRGEERVMVLLDVMQQAQRVELPESALS